jgi:predicted DNA-binding transcriptional regulator AlpA
VSHSLWVKFVMTEPDPLVGVAYIAHATGLHRTGIYRLLREGTFGPPVDVASVGSSRASWRVHRSGVDAWIKSRTLSKTA